MKICLHLFLFLLSTSFLPACNTNSTIEKKQKIYTVMPQNMDKTLYFTGTLEPLRTNSLVSPVDATIEIMHSHFGQTVKKSEILFTLNSPELQKQYNEILTDYLKAKDNFTTTRSKFVGTEDLWQAGLISKNNYLSEKLSLNTARITLMQATRKLSEMLEKTGSKIDPELSTLSFAEFDKVNHALNRPHHLINLKAPNEGVLLYPPKSTEDKNNEIAIGSAIKAGQALALIGDLSGVQVKIDIPEVDIDKVQPGMTAIVRSVAFPRDELHGRIVTLNAQASLSHGGTLPSFTATVEVRKLTPSQQAWVKVGMSAAVELATNKTDKLLIPIAAVKQQHGQSIVQVRTKTGTIEPRVVTTGAALADQVAIDAGLKAGEVIIYD